jgi:flagellar hook-length control protein FliK
MSTPGFPISANANAASAARGANAGFGAEPAAPEIDGRDGGFAAALDEATIEAALNEASAPDRRESDADASTSAEAAATPANPVAEPAIDAPTNTPVADATAGLDAAASNAGGWPPPGLSSLFPASPLFAASAPAATPSTMPASGGAPLSTPASTTLAPPALAASAPAAAASVANHAVPPLLARAEGGAIALPPGLLGAAPPRAPEGLPAVASASALGPLASPALAPTPAPLAANAAALDPITAALARQPAPLRLPIADESEVTGIAALAEALAPERLPDGAAPSSSTTAPLPKLDLAQAFPAPVPMPSPKFAEDLGARLQWMAAQQGGDATLRIAPEGLGPVEIRLKLDGERVDLGFSATQQDTRQALQDALPKLREMLAQQGLQLGDANVGQRHAGQASNGDAKGERGFGDDEGGIVIGSPRASEATLVMGRGARGVLDLYA